MASGGPDLFVICKHCGAEVSPYITECPYCGNRLQKRAPKLDRDGQISERRRRRPPSPTLPRLRRGEMPGIRHDQAPFATILLLLLGFAGTLLWRTALINPAQLVAFGSLHTDPWRVLSSPFVYANTWYAVITLGVVALFGVLTERRHGLFVVLGLFLVGAVGGTAVALVVSANLAMGANGGALALLVAWSIPDLMTLAAHEEVEGDLLGAGVLALVVALMPLAAPEASWICDAVGVSAGILLGYPLARIRPA